MHGAARRLFHVASTLRPLSAAGGLVGGFAALSMSAPAHAAPAAAPPSALSPDEFRSFKLGKAVVGLPVASCLVTRAPIGEGGKQVIRPYTPISKPNEVGSFDLLIKSYDNGVMSKHFSTLKPGDALEFKGPIMKLAWKPNLKKSLGLVAGGTGITPMLQLIDAVLSNSGEDKTHITLLYGNNTEDDILLRSKLEQLAAAHPKQFKVVFVVAKPSPGWTGRTGHATPAMLKELMPPPASDALVVVCGPPGLMNAISGDKAPDKSQGPVGGALKDLGYDETMVYKM